MLKGKGINRISFISEQTSYALKTISEAYHNKRNKLLVNKLGRKTNQWVLKLTSSCNYKYSRSQIWSVRGCQPKQRHHCTQMHCTCTIQSIKLLFYSMRAFSIVWTLCIDIRVLNAIIIGGCKLKLSHETTGFRLALAASLARVGHQRNILDVIREAYSYFFLSITDGLHSLSRVRSSKPFRFPLSKLRFTQAQSASCNFTGS